MKTKYFYYVAKWSDNRGRKGIVNALQAKEGVAHFLLHDNRSQIAYSLGIPLVNVAIVNHMEITKEEAELFKKDATL